MCPLPFASTKETAKDVRRAVWAAALACLIIATWCTAAAAQFPVQSGVGSGGVQIPETNLAPIAPPSSPPSSTGYGNFDPYATPSTPSLGTSRGGSSFGGSAFGGSAGSTAIPGVNSGLGPGINNATIGPPSPILPSTPGSIPPSPPGASLFSRIFSRPASGPAAPGFGTQLQGPVVNSPSLGGPSPGNFADPYGQPIGSSGGAYGGPAYAPPPPAGYPSSAYPATAPSTLFPNGLVQGGYFPGSVNGFSAFRLFQGPRLRHTWVSAGNDKDDLGTNDTDVSVIFAFPNFLYSTQPLYVIPSFSLHLWDGPISPPADLPANAYSAFLDIGWNSDPNQMFSTEFGVRVGVFTDFDTYNSKSFRVLGKALASFRITPTSTLKGGVYYLDRNDIKLVPAGGILCQPNPFTRIDLFFPQPKYARYFRTVGTRDVWWYLAGDYGGGSWTVERTNGFEDSIDINELRVLLGLEWGTSDAIRAGRRSAFFEVGYAFDREVEYYFNPADNFKPRDGVMLRAGIGY